MDAINKILGSGVQMPADENCQFSLVGQKRSYRQAFAGDDLSGRLPDAPGLANASSGESTPKRPTTQAQGHGMYSGYPITPEQPQRSFSGSPAEALKAQRQQYATIFKIHSGQAKDTALMQLLSINDLAGKKLAIEEFRQSPYGDDIERTPLSTGQQSATYIINSIDGQASYVFRPIVLDDYKKEGKKPSAILPEWALEALGRNPVQPQAIQRKFIAHQLDQALGFKLLPELKGLLITHSTCGTVEACIEGAQTLANVLSQKANELHQTVRKQPSLLTRLTLLQIFDGLIGELDRHGGNILLQTKEGNWELWGVDTDQCLPESSQTLNEKLGKAFSKCKDNPMNPEKRVQCYLCDWPVIVTQGIREFVNQNVTVQRARDALGQAPYAAVCSEEQKSSIVGQIQNLRRYLGLDGEAPDTRLKIINETEWLADASLQHWATQRTQHWNQGSVTRNFSYLTPLLLPMVAQADAAPEAAGLV
jgi:hypothetical protein